MRKRTDIRHLVLHNFYGMAANFHFFRKRFWIPLETDNLEQAAWRIDVAAKHLGEFFEEAYEPNCPEDIELTNSTVDPSTYLDGFEKSSGGFSPMPIQGKAHIFNGISNTLGLRSFYWNLRKAQLNVARVAEMADIDLSQLAIRRQQGRKAEAVVFKARKAAKEMIDTHKHERILFRARSLKATAQHQLLKHSKLVNEISKTGCGYAASSYQYQIKTRFDKSVTLYKQLETLASETVELIEKANESKV